ncbi:MAG: guanylyltransferase [Anaerolineae bacterium]|nr:guanylyltransferase [Anaerolineae bacterium]
MDFDELDRHMRVFETNADACVLPSIYMVARVDGRSFTRLTKERHNFAAPFDERMRDLMVETTMHLMQCGFRAVYGYTQSDEISLLLHRDDATFQRKLRKVHSVLAGEASAKFSLLLGDLGCFDCRICQLPTLERVVDYFRWRMEDAGRNALNSHCYWLLRKQGSSVREATHRLEGLSVADKNELLFANSINFNDLPAWQKRGVGVYWEQFDKEGYNPITQQTVTTQRQRLLIQYDLPMRESYSQLIEKILSETHL